MCVSVCVKSKTLSFHVLYFIHVPKCEDIHNLKGLSVCHDLVLWLRLELDCRVVVGVEHLTVMIEIRMGARECIMSVFTTTERPTCV